MPKTKAKETVLHDWVCLLPFQMQALLLTAMRGPDGNTKQNAAKSIIRYLRGIIIKAAGDWAGDNQDDDFMWGDYTKFNEYAFLFWHNHDEYPHHFIMHLIHCAEIVGYKHPNIHMRDFWYEFYLDACTTLHMNPETEAEMDERLNDFSVGYHNQ